GECVCFIFFFQAEDGIRDRNVTGVQTCALPIYETVEFSVPEEGGIDVDLTAGESGEVVITAGEIVTVVHAGVAGIELDVEVTCNPTENNDSLVLNEIPIKDPADEDTTPPEITLNGDNPMELEVGEEYVEPGAK